MASKSLLIADDDVELCELLAQFLQAEGFAVSCVHNGAEAIATLQRNTYSLLLLDVMMPVMDGFDVLRSVRKNSNLPVLMLTAKGDEIDRIVGLELGADDYLAKPFNPRELLARVRAILRRSTQSGQSGETLSVGKLVLNGATRQVRYAESVLELTSAEFALLAVLMAQAGHVVSRDELSQRGLGRGLLPYDRSVDVHIGKLRKKLAAIDPQRDWIVAVRGLGYQLLQLVE
jgi:DNA-binding response OmpR family regulator